MDRALVFGSWDVWYVQIRIEKIKATLERVWHHCGEAKTTVVTEKEAAQLQQLPRVSIFHLK